MPLYGRRGSMTAAADEERTTQLSISQRIRALEERLGQIEQQRASQA